MRKHSVISTLVWAMAGAANSTVMVEDANGNFIVDPMAPASARVSCYGHTASLTSSNYDSDGDYFYLEHLAVMEAHPVLKNITFELRPYLNQNHDLRRARMICLPSEGKIGLEIPAVSEDETLHLMIMTDGRIINGYDLTGHDYQVGED